MPPPTGSLFNRQSTRITEIINKDIKVFLPSLDPAWTDTFTSSVGVIPSGQLGRDMLVKRLYMGSLSGVMEPGAPRGDFTTYGDQTTLYGSKFFTQSVAQTFPDVRESPNQAAIPLLIPIKSILTNLPMTIGDLQAEATPAFIGTVIQPRLKGFARNLSQMLCNYWYVSQSSSYQLSGMGTTASQTTSGGSGSTYFITFTPDNYAIDRYMIGMRVDIYNSAGSLRKNDTQTSLANQTLTTRTPCWVYSVDEVTNKVTLVLTTDAWDTSTTARTNSDIVVPANSRLGSSVGFTGIAGINSWLKAGDASGSSVTDANTLLGSSESVTNGQINVNTHPEFKSWFKAVNNVLTEHRLRQYVRGFNRAKSRYGGMIDCLIASDGVWLAYEGQKIGRETIERGGRLSSVNNEGSQEGFTFTFDGQKLKGYTSNYIESGVMYGLKKGGNNWRKIVPPSPKGAKKDPNQEEDFGAFEFLGPVLSQSDSIFLPYRNSSVNNAQLNEMMEAPGHLRINLVPWDQVYGMKLTGLTEDRVYGD